MKKVLILFSTVIIIISIIGFQYANNQKLYNRAMEKNAEFEEYYQKEIYGTDLTTLINKVVDENTRNKIEKDAEGKFIHNSENSINIEVKITDTNKIYEMEKFYNGGMEKFVQFYGTMKFKCTNIEYHEKTKKVKYLYFEQI